MKKYKLNKGFITQKMGEKTTVFSGQDSMLFTLNQTASYIFQGLKLGWEQTKIIDGLIETYKIDKKRAQEDMRDFIKELKEKKIIVEQSL